MISALSVFWAAWLIAFGGFDVNIAGIRITTNEPLRPLALASLAFAVFAAAHGVAHTRAACVAALSRFDDRWVAMALAAVTSVMGIAYCTTSAGGADSYGYVSEADLWLQGDLRIRQPWVADVPWPNAQWTFTPLGYRPVEGVADPQIVPTYSPGLPLLMAAAKSIGGQEALFWIVPLSGGVLVLATFGIGQRLGSPRAGLIAAWLTATSPLVLFMLMPPMTDVPVAAAWAAAFCFMLGRGPGSALLAGLAAALAVLIRPNLAPLAAVLGFWFLIRRHGVENDTGSRFTNPLRVFGGFVKRLPVSFSYAAPLIAGVIAIAAIYTNLYGSPLMSGYGGLGDAFGWAHVRPNVRNYFVWFVESQTWLGVLGLLAVCIPLRRWWPYVADRRIFFITGLFLLAITVHYVTYLVFDTWWFLRFFLPCWPSVTLGLATVFASLAQSRHATVALVSVWLVLALGAVGVHRATQLGAFGAWIGERRYVAVARTVAERTPANSVVLTLLHSGSVRYYGSRMTMRFDQLEGEWLDRSVAWMRDRGVRSFALLEAWEIPDFKKRFAGQKIAERLDEALVVVHMGTTTTSVYDLSEPVVAPPQRIRTEMTGLRSARPAPPPTLTWAAPRRE